MWIFETVLARRALALAALTAPAHAANAAPTQRVLIAAKDPSGDVRIVRRNKGLTRAERSTADLRKVTIEQVDDRRARITVKFRRLAPSNVPWNQATVIGFIEEPGSWLEVGAVLQQHRDFEAFAYNNLPRGRTCSLRLVRRPAERTLSVVVPMRCMPDDGWQGWVKTSTEVLDDPTAEEQTWTVFSRDFRRLPVLHYR